MSKDDRLDLLVDKIKKGVQYSFRIFLNSAKKNNKKLVSMRNGKVVLVPARSVK